MKKAVLLLLACLMALTNSAQQSEITVQAAGLLTGPNVYEVTLNFSAPVDLQSASTPENYSIGGTNLPVSAFYLNSSTSVVLTLNHLSIDQSYTLTVTNVMDLAGATISTNLSIFTRLIGWVPIGSQEQGFTPQAVSVGTNGFDLYSGGFQMFDIYDEATFVYEEITGNFDRAVRISRQDPSSDFARAGLMVRESLDAGKPRPSNPNSLEEAFSRYLDVHVNPSITAEGNARTDLYEISVREFTGGINRIEINATVNPPITNNITPVYPDVWVRMTRLGDQFTLYRGTNGVDWVRIGSFSFRTNDINNDPVQPFPQTVYAGPFYSPENGNIPAASGLRNLFKAEFRDYSGTNNPSNSGEISLSLAKTSNGLELTWSGGILQTSTNLTSPWSNLSVTSPLTLTAQSNEVRFYRVSQ
ncbi:MAG: hypothetical protein SFY81_09805 [Verrucomicrobiota bacterium]|nr:hypothetical protein [Verrucomicrobiota bacterium]